MREKHLFEYAIVRIVPLVEREEFINAGVIVYSRQMKFLKTLFQLNETKLIALAPDADIPLIKEHILAFTKICNGSEDSGPIGKLAPHERFRWLTATRSTIIQTSRVHPGLCPDPEEMVHKLLKLHVL